MSLRTYIYNLITTDVELNSLGINGDSTFLNHSVDTPQVRPLCILRWQATNVGLPNIEELWPHNQRALQVWIHDSINHGDFDRIDASLFRLRTILTGLQAVHVGIDAEWLSCVYWEGDSDDLRDDDMQTISRNSQFRFTGSGF